MKLQTILSFLLLLLCVGTTVNSINEYDYYDFHDNVNYFDIDCGHNATDDPIIITYHGDIAMVYDRENPLTCALKRVAPLLFRLIIGKNSSNCGIKKLGGVDAYFMDFVVQTGPVRRAADKVYSITCTYEIEKTAESPKQDTADKNTDTVPQMAGRAKVTDHAFNLRIKDSQGKTLESASLGEYVRLEATFTPSNDQEGFVVWNCLATDGVLKSPNVYWILQSGCGDGEVIGNRKGFQVSGVQARSPYFRAFKLPGATTLQFQCDILVCSDMESCSGSSCGAAVPDRRRRSLRAASQAMVGIQQQLMSLLENGHKRRRRALNPPEPTPANTYKVFTQVIEIIEITGSGDKQTRDTDSSPDPQVVQQEPFPLPALITTGIMAFLSLVSLVFAVCLYMKLRAKRAESSPNDMSSSLEPLTSGALLVPSTSPGGAPTSLSAPTTTATTGPPATGDTQPSAGDGTGSPGQADTSLTPLLEDMSQRAPGPSMAEPAATNGAQSGGQAAHRRNYVDSWGKTDGPSIVGNLVDEILDKDGWLIEGAEASVKVVVVEDSPSSPGSAGSLPARQGDWLYRPTALHQGAYDDHEDFGREPHDVEARPLTGATVNKPTRTTGVKSKGKRK